MWTDRTEILVGREGIDLLSKAKVAVVGIGGVGGYVAYLLARAGIGNLTLIDFDVVDETNINRQIVADTATVGQKKVDVMRNILEKINPKCQIKTHCAKVCAENLQSLNLNECDFVVDAIDSVADKVELICYCKENNINVVSAMGAGNRTCLPEFKVVDIYQTHSDGLAKSIRKKLRERQIVSLDVVTTDSKPIQNGYKIEMNDKENQKRLVGSISYFPAMCGCVLAGYVVNKLLKT